MAVFRDQARTVRGLPKFSLAAEPYSDLLRALSSSPRRIPAKYFYDDRGSDLFAKITELPEYYLTRTEEAILTEHARAMIRSCGSGKSLSIVELGAGDGRKTLHLLRAALSEVKDVRYKPVDISPSALDSLDLRIKSRLPELAIEPCVLDMENHFDRLPLDPERPNLVLYLGSSIGNLQPTEQLEFFTRLRRTMKPDDSLLIGFDLKKDAKTLIKAYDDSRGITREFNMNLIRRLNSELEANFDEDSFEHHASYNPSTGSMESWLISSRVQNIEIERLDFRFRLEAFEGLHVETSWKFSQSEIDALARETGFQVLARHTDWREWFAVDVWQAGLSSHH